MNVRDRRGRPLRAVRISVTDRCNMRCTYCMPRSHFGPGTAFIPSRDLLSPAHIERLGQAFASLGARTIRLTGGEPLLRSDLIDIVGRLAALPIDDLALTTNGALLARHARSLRASGLNRVTVSLDTLDPALFARITDVGVELDAVLSGIEAARIAGFAPVKINCVMQRGVNEAGVLDLVEFARQGGHILRFIEYMDVGGSNGWQGDRVVPTRELIERIGEVHPLAAAAEPDEGVASRFLFSDGAGEVGFISSVTQPFCGDCGRARVSADGRLYTCLFASDGYDLGAQLRDGASAEAIAGTLAARWALRDDRYSELRGTVQLMGKRVEMSRVGG